MVTGFLWFQEFSAFIVLSSIMQFLRFPARYVVFSRFPTLLVFSVFPEFSAFQGFLSALCVPLVVTGVLSDLRHS